MVCDLSFRCLTHVLENCETTSSEIVIRSEEPILNGFEPGLRKRRIAFLTPENRFGQVNHLSGQSIVSFIRNVIYEGKMTNVDRSSISIG